MKGDKMESTDLTKAVSDLLVEAEGLAGKLSDIEKTLIEFAFSRGMYFEAKRVDKGLDKLLSENRGVDEIVEDL